MSTRENSITRLPDQPFLGLPVCGDLSQLNAAAAIIGVPIATPYPNSGLFAAASPNAIRAAMGTYGSQLGHHDFEIDGSLLEDQFGAVVDAGDLATDESDFAANRAGITAAVRQIIEVGAVPIVIGGDDSVPIPVIEAYDGQPLTVLQIDAHIDWRDEVQGERYGLSSNMRRASEMPWIEQIVQVGMRSVGSARRNEYEAALEWGVNIVTARSILRNGVDPVVDLIPAVGNVYVAFDCDSMDSSVMPAVMAPTPGGLTYWDVVDLLHAVGSRATLVGFSLVEFMPENDGSGNAALTAARIVLHAAAVAARKADVRHNRR